MKNEQGFLSLWGWRETPAPINEFREDRHTLARVLEEQRDWLTVQTPQGAWDVQLPKKLRKGQAQIEEAPSVGDWVLIEKIGSGWVVRQVVGRRNHFARKDVSQTGSLQCLATNVDLVAVVVPAFPVEDLKIARKYGWWSLKNQLSTVAIITKIDLLEESFEDWRAATEFESDVSLYPVSLKTGEGISQIRSLFAPGTTTALIGPSGAGKSTLINSLLGGVSQKTQEVRAKDQRGRHTTTTRRLFRIPELGAMVIDLPGIRPPLEHEMKEGHNQALVQRLEELSLRCRFSNCGHLSEPGCALKAAVLAGELTRNDFDDYLEHLASLK